MSILVTGSTGFIGRALIKELLSVNYHVSASVRYKDSFVPDDIEKVVVGNISSSTDWSQALRGVSVVIHCAGRAHVMNKSELNLLAEFRKVNTAGTLSLARQATTKGVKRFIFISSIGVNGNYSTSPFLETDKIDPKEAYAISKTEAEIGLLVLAEEAAMEVVIIRPPLVYGGNAPGNFGYLIKWMNKGIPLPLGAIYNKRSLVALDNLVNFIIHCLENPKAANEVFLISDGEDVSTTELLQKVAKVFGIRSLLIPVPVWLMLLAAKLIGKEDMANRLFGSLQVDNSKACDLLGWKPVITMDEQLKKIADEA